jgi:hypothetical protein
MGTDAFVYRERTLIMTTRYQQDFLVLGKSSHQYHDQKIEICDDLDNADDRLFCQRWYFDSSCGRDVNLPV